MSNNKIPLLYSPRHKEHAPSVELWNGKLVSYPEVPQRIENIKESLAATGWTSLSEVQEVIPREAITKVHDPGMVDYLEQMSTEVADFLADPDNFYATDHHMEAQQYFFPAVFPIRSSMMRIKESTGGRHGYYCFDMEAPIGTGTWRAALYAASLAYAGANMLLNQEADIVYPVCRPPGHHVGPDFFGGYCYLNNASIATKRLMELGRVALIDVDYHHGNGSQLIFWDEPQVLFCSIHAHPDEEYPFVAGYTDEVGGPNAEGTNVNVPLRRRSSQKDYLKAFDEIIEKAADFRPAALVLSMGFDTYKDDPVAFFNVDHEGYYHIGRSMAAMGLPLLIVQEGGYRVEALGELAESLVRGVLGL
jgi:acetoin utilization deacetylase AcuC-like enzyme